jgi:hypothetical protein
MTDETTTQAPEAGATEVVSTPPTTEQARGPDGKFASTPPAGETGATTEAEAPEQAADDEPPKKDDEPKRNRARERIDQLTAEKHAAIREAQALRQRLAALQQQRPAQIDPDDYDAQQREQFRSVMREEQYGQTAQQYEDAVRRAYEVQAQAFTTKVEAARERIPNIDQSLQTFYQLPVSEHAGEIIAESDYAAEIAHYMAQNPGEAYAIHQMTPAQQGRALARIEAKFNLPTRKISTAPPPPPSVTGAQPARERSPQEMSASEYMEWRQKQWKSGAR